MSTNRQFLDKLMQHTGCRTHASLATLTALSHTSLHHLYHGNAHDMRISTLRKISETTGIKVSALAAWFVGEPLE